MRISFTEVKISNYQNKKIARERHLQYIKVSKDYDQSADAVVKRPIPQHSLVQRLLEICLHIIY